MIRTLGRAIWESHGYTVLEAEDGQAAVELYSAEKDRIDLVILDVTMPRMSGRDACRHIIHTNPTARVLFSSGYSADDLSDVDGSRGLLSKPYRPIDLLTAVHTALGREPAAAL
jgi:two-component system, cell cycle sensor histidine kinase and response regulator CckA